jgi:hypothetical protein
MGIIRSAANQTKNDTKFDRGSIRSDPSRLHSRKRRLRRPTPPHLEVEPSFHTKYMELLSGDVL